MYLFFDTETTGLPKNYKASVSDLDNWPRLVQLAYLFYDDDGNEIEGGDFIIKPDNFTIPVESSKIHRITNEIAQEKGVDLKIVMEKFKELIEKSTKLVAHNMAFDEKIVGAEFLRCGMIDFVSTKPKICTMLKTVNVCKLEGKFGYKWPKLFELHQYLFDEDFAEAHNAAADINATAKCFWELKHRGIL
jgi:DNA polymerase III epsilon subunit-like protein